MISSPSSRRIVLSYLIALLPAVLFYTLVRIPPQEDAEIYWKLGKQWAETGVYGVPDSPTSPEGYWPVGYPAFVSSVVTMFGKDPRVVVSCNMLLYAVMIALAGRIGYLTYGEKVASLTMILTGTIYDIFTLPSLVLSENIFMPLFLGGIVLILEPGKQGRIVRWGLAGLVLGCACLTRGVLLALPPFLVVAVSLWIWQPWRQRQRIILHLLLLSAGFCIPVGFWVQRNFEVFDIFVPVSLNAGENMALAHNKYNTYWYLDSNDPRRRRIGLFGSDRDKHMRGMYTAMEEITGNPVGFVVKSFIRAYWTFAGESPWWANRAILEPPPVGLGVNMIYLQTLLLWQWVVFMYFVLNGAWFGQHTDSPARLLLLGLCAYWVFLHSTQVIHPRYRIPIVPIFAVYAAFYLVYVRKHNRKWKELAMEGVPSLP